MRHELRGYQSEAVDAVFDKWKTDKNTLLVLPTGTGKTTVIAAIAERVVQGGGRFMFCAHTTELCQQAGREIEAFTGIPCAIEKASETAQDALSPITIASIQSIGQSRRMQRFSPSHYDVVGVDEGHRVLGGMYRRVFNYFDGAKGLGCTATPDRTDKQALSQVFDSIAYEYRLTDAIKDGYLVPIKAQQMPLTIDLSKVRMKHGDWDENDLDDAIRPHLEAIAREVCKHDRFGIHFLPLIDTAQKLAGIVKGMGVKAEAVWGTDPDRAGKIDALTSGELQHLFNSSLLTEGVNCPRVSLIGPYIPTKSRSRYIQQIGRGTRLFEGKEDMLILDPLWLASKHKACTPASLFGETAEIVELAEEKRKLNGGRGDPMQDVQEAVSDYARQREQRIAEEIERNRWKKARSINPLDFAVMVHDTDLTLYTPVFKWESAPASDKQKAYLQDKGFDVAGMTKGMAHQLFEGLKKRNGMATPKQVRKLDQLGVKEAHKYSFTEAGKILDVATACEWVKPKVMNVCIKKGLLK